MYEVQWESGETEWLTEKSVKNLGPVAREWVRDYDDDPGDDVERDCQEESDDSESMVTGEGVHLLYARTPEPLPTKFGTNEEVP